MTEWKMDEVPLRLYTIFHVQHHLDINTSDQLQGIFMLSIEIVI